MLPFVIYSNTFVHFLLFFSWLYWSICVVYAVIFCNTPYWEKITWSTRKKSEKWIFLGVWIFFVIWFFTTCVLLKYVLLWFKYLLFIVYFSLDLPMMSITRYWFISYLKLLLKVTLKHWKGNLYNNIDATIILWEEGVGSKSMHNKNNKNVSN